MLFAKTNKVTESGMIFTGKGILFDILLGMDGLNDPTISIFDGTDSGGVEKLPTNTYDASKLGLNGVIWQAPRLMNTGAYALISIAAGDVEVVGGYRPWSELIGNLGSAFQPIR